MFKGTHVGAFTDGTGSLGNGDNIESTAGKGSGGGSLAPWGTRTVAAPVISIIAGDAFVLAVVVVVSRNLAAEGGVGVAIPPQS